ncbi:ABC transporter ATP-binding protein [Bacillus massilinigeriensis]|uniref:ABC transporter ATP-binding protein n=1 Tax=Bacillus mediterraneensis TaxID=1805474 RepID=UPI0008F7ED2C|nr:ABC transporter ATP-binding protein [Bacillus mediterraneensis]
MKIINVSKTYKDHTVLANAQMELERGTINGLVGKNGAGKTTLMKIICGNIVNFEGRVEIPANTSVGYLIEHPKFYAHESGLFNLKYFQQIFTNKVDMNFLNKIIDTLEMKQYMNKKVRNYSLGMKQRLGIAIALLRKPDYLILDEPTNGMDPEGTISILTTIKQIAKENNMAILISSHKLEDIEFISDNIIYIDGGRIKDIVNKQNLTNSGLIVFTFSQKDVKAAYAILQDGIRNVQVEGNIIKTEYMEDYSEILKNLAANNIFPLNIEKKVTSVKDYYFHLSEKGEEVL